MGDFHVSLNVDKVGLIEFDITEETFKRFSKFCLEKFPEKDWKASEISP